MESATAGLAPPAAFELGSGGVLWLGSGTFSTMTDYDQRMRIARGILFMALALFVMSYFLPQFVSPVSRMVGWNGGKMALWSADIWMELVRMKMPLDRHDVVLLVAVMKVVFVHLVVVSAPWLAGVYSRSGALRGIACLIAGICALRSAAEFVGEVNPGITWEPGIGGGVECAGVVLLAIGMLLIPRRPQEMG